MITGSGIPATAPPSDQPSKRGFLGMPSTRLGWWAVALAATFLVLFIIISMVLVPRIDKALWRQTLLPFYGIFMMLFCLSTWIIGLIAVMRRGERSWLVWLTLLFGLLVLCLLLFELLVPH